MLQKDLIYQIDQNAKRSVESRDTKIVEKCTTKCPWSLHVSQRAVLDSGLNMNIHEHNMNSWFLNIHHVEHKHICIVIVMHCDFNQVTTDSTK